MFQTSNPALADFIAILKEKPTAIAETFVVSNDESQAVRLVVSQGEVDIAVDVEVLLSPNGCNVDYLDPYLTEESCDALVSQGLLSADPFDAIGEGSKIALALTMLHRDRITKTARDKFARKVLRGVP